jgi:hypothetical protein
MKCVVLFFEEKRICTNVVVLDVVVNHLEFNAFLKAKKLAVTRKFVILRLLQKKIKRRFFLEIFIFTKMKIFSAMKKDHQWWLSSQPFQRLWRVSLLRARLSFLHSSHCAPLLFGFFFVF